MPQNVLILDSLDGYQFEDLVSRIMKKRGYLNIINKQSSRDLGKDIIMDDAQGNRIVVECKHQKFVGRPIVQKLQGAMNHELTRNNLGSVKGIIVTSGTFSKEAIEYVKDISQNIELIDGKSLKKICDDLGLFVLNGKVQILVNKSFDNITENDAKNLSNNFYDKINGSKLLKNSIFTKLSFEPICYISYNIGFDTYTSKRRVDSYHRSGHIIIDGLDGEELSEELSNFLHKGIFKQKEIGEKYSKVKIPYKFTENDIEERAINKIIDEHTHFVGYFGGNNRYYTKECIPKKRDIDIKEFIPLYLPCWDNNLNILRRSYGQKFYVNGKNHFFIEDLLKNCTICHKTKVDYSDMFLCFECGRITCWWHKKMDYLDKKTPICNIHKKPFKLFLEKKYFATKENLKAYQIKWKEMSWLKKIYEDKILFSLVVILGACSGLLYLNYFI